MLKILFAAALIGATLSVPAAQALDARGGQATGPTATFTADVQLVGGRHWGGDRHWGGNRHRGYRYERLGPRQIKRRLARRGFHDMRNLRMRGEVYVLRARGPRGVPQRLVVNAYSGEIVGRTPLGPRWRPGPGRW